jgi:hypothetical protein
MLQILCGQRFQKVLFPDGLEYDPVEKFGTGENAWPVRLIGEFSAPVSSMAPPRGHVWNRTLSFMKEIEGIGDVLRA